MHGRLIELPVKFKSDTLPNATSDELRSGFASQQADSEQLKTPACQGQRQGQRAVALQVQGYTPSFLYRLIFPVCYLCVSVSDIPNDVPEATTSHWDMIRTNGADSFVAVPQVRETCSEVE